MAPFEALYGRRCRTPLCWFESGESIVLGPELVQQTTEKVKMIREKMKASQDRQKSYHDKRRKALEFQEGDHVFLPITFEIVTDECAENKVLPITFKIVTDKYAENKNLADYF